MSSTLRPFGLCPFCSTPLRYNPRNELIECPALGCGYYREYSSQDRENINQQAAEEFMNFQKWDAIYAGTPVTTPWEGKVIHPGLSQSSERNASPEGNASDEN